MLFQYGAEVVSNRTNGKCEKGKVEEENLERQRELGALKHAIAQGNFSGEECFFQSIA